MANKTLNTRICLRSDKTANWNANPSAILLKGEIGIEILTTGKMKFKIGTGEGSPNSTWGNLPYFNGGISSITTTGTGNVVSGITYDTETEILTVAKNITAIESETPLEESDAVDSGITLSAIKFVAGSDPITVNGHTINSKYRKLKGTETLLITPQANGDIEVSGSYLKTTAYGSKGAVLWLTTNKSDTTPGITQMMTGSNVAIIGGGSTTVSMGTEPDGPSIVIDSEDTGATSAEVTGAGVAVNSVSYNATTRKLTLTKGFNETSITVNDDDESQGIVTAILKGTGSHEISSTKGIKYTTLQPTSSSTNGDLPTSKAVYDALAAAISAIDAMHYKGTVGTGGSAGTALPTTNVNPGDTYKVVSAGTYAGTAASLGDLFIALTSAPTWDYVPSGNDGNVYHSSSLTTNQVIVGNNGDDVKALAAGSNGQVLKMVSGNPAWSNDTDTGATSVETTGTGDAVDSASYNATTRKLTLTKGFNETPLALEEEDAVGGARPISVISEMTLSGNKDHTITVKKSEIQVSDDLTLSGSGVQGQTILGVSYTKTNLTNKLNADTDTLVLDGGSAGSWN